MLHVYSLEVHLECADENAGRRQEEIEYNLVRLAESVEGSAADRRRAALQWVKAWNELVEAMTLK